LEEAFVRDPVEALSKENRWQHSLNSSVKYQFIVVRSIQNPLRQEKLLNFFLQHYRIIAKNLLCRLLCLLIWPMTIMLFAINKFSHVLLYDLLRYNASQVVFGLKIADVELNTHFNYFNPSRVYPNNAMRQVII
jgi:hypothetical protein